VNFYQACSAAMRARPDRRVVISDTANFPTDRYVLQGTCDREGRELVLIDDEDGEGYVTPAALSAALDDDAALVTLSVVQYRSGALHDVAELTRLAHEAGALVVWDASHAVGVVPLEFDAHDVDLAVGCTYKYGNSGPGSPAWLYVNRRLQDELRVPIQGWFAQVDQFAMGPDFERAEGIRGFQVASPPLLGLRCVRSGFEMIERAGIDAIARKGAVGTELMIALADAWLAKLGFALVTPRDPVRRGGHVTLRHPEARAISLALREHAAVVADFRRPDCLRLAISPLATSYVEVWDGFARLRELVATGAHRATAAGSSRVT
jgi:kynureninase